MDEETVYGYVTLAEAEEYIASHFIYDDPLRSAWDALEAADKIVLLTRSFDSIEMLPSVGRKTEENQPNAFPRWPLTEVPKEIKMAQIDNAITLLDSSATEDAEHYRTLWRYGVNAYVIGNLSEKIGEGAWGNSPTANAEIVSNKAETLLKRFLRGSYTIRGSKV